MDWYISLFFQSMFKVKISKVFITINVSFIFISGVSVIVLVKYESFFIKLKLNLTVKLRKKFVYFIEYSIKILKNLTITTKIIELISNTSRYF